MQLSSELVDFLQQQLWPGNIRQLENAIARCIALATMKVVGLEIVNDIVLQNQQVTTPEDTALTLALHVTATDLAKVVLTPTRGPSHGELTVAGDTWTYTPQENFAGSDEIDFEAIDARGDGYSSASATLVRQLWAVLPALGLDHPRFDREHRDDHARELDLRHGAGQQPGNHHAACRALSRPTAEAARRAACASIAAR